MEYICILSLNQILFKQNVPGFHKHKSLLKMITRDELDQSNIKLSDTLTQQLVLACKRLLHYGKNSYKFFIYNLFNFINPFTNAFQYL